MAPDQIKKMKQGMSYSCKEKTIILNVFKYFKQQYSELCVTEIVRRTSKATGCSEKSIFQFRKEESSVGGFKEPSKTKIRKNININSRDIKYDQNVRQGIRDIIYDLKYQGIVPSLNTILKRVNGDKKLPDFSVMTLRRLLFDMGFCYEKEGNKAVLVEKRDKNDKNNVPKAKNAPNVNNTPNTNVNTNTTPNTNINSTPNANINSNNGVQQLPMQVLHNNVMPGHSQGQVPEGHFPRLMQMDVRQSDIYQMPLHPMHGNHNMPVMVHHRSEVIHHHASNGQIPPPHSGMGLPLKPDLPNWMNPIVEHPMINK